jgi:antitoxin component of MazEF toxin-antitoxin module
VVIPPRVRQHLKVEKGSQLQWFFQGNGEVRLLNVTRAIRDALHT